MGQRNLLAQKMRQILVGKWRWTAECRQMQERRTSSSGRSLFASPWCDFPSIFSFGSTSQRVRYWGLKGFGSLLDWRSMVACISPCISHAAILTDPLLYAFIFHFLRWVSWSAPLFCRHQWSLDTRCRDSIGVHRSQPRERISRDFGWLACSSCCPKGTGGAGQSIVVLPRETHPWRCTYTHHTICWLGCIYFVHTLLPLTVDAQITVNKNPNIWFDVMRWYNNSLIWSADDFRLASSLGVEQVF